MRRSRAPVGLRLLALGVAVAGGAALGVVAIVAMGRDAWREAREVRDGRRHRARPAAQRPQVHVEARWRGDVDEALRRSEAALVEPADVSDDPGADAVCRALGALARERRAPRPHRAIWLPVPGGHVGISPLGDEMGGPRA